MRMKRKDKLRVEILARIIMGSKDYFVAKSSGTRNNVGSLNPKIKNLNNYMISNFK